VDQALPARLGLLDLLPGQPQALRTEREVAAVLAVADPRFEHILQLRHRGDLHYEPPVDVRHGGRNGREPLAQASTDHDRRSPRDVSPCEQRGQCPRSAYRAHVVVLPVRLAQHAVLGVDHPEVAVHRADLRVGLEDLDLPRRLCHRPQVIGIQQRP
jgi:hypothetical protein